jgi:hypothetical protein
MDSPSQRAGALEREEVVEVLDVREGEKNRCVMEIGNRNTWRRWTTDRSWLSEVVFVVVKGGVSQRHGTNRGVT